MDEFEDIDDATHEALLNDLRKIDGNKIQSKQTRSVRFTNYADSNENLNSFLENLEKKNIKKSNFQTLKTPLEKPVAKRLKRAAGFEDVAIDVNRWSGVVDHNRNADQLSFPLNKADVRVVTSEKNYKPQMKTKMEQDIYNLLTGAKLIKQKEKSEEEEAIERAMSLKEIRERSQEIWRSRILRQRLEKKAFMLNKSKSRKYHKVLKREKLRQMKSKFEQLKHTDPEAALAVLEEIDRNRIMERMNLRHGKSKWIQAQGVRAGRDKSIKDVLQENADIRKDLLEKLKLPNKSAIQDSEGEDASDEDDQVIEVKDEQVMAILKKQKKEIESGKYDSLNAWVSQLAVQQDSEKSKGSKDPSFLQMKRFWDEQHDKKASQKNSNSGQESNSKNKNKVKNSKTKNDSQESMSESDLSSTVSNEYSDSELQNFASSDEKKTNKIIRLKNSRGSKDKNKTNKSDKIVKLNLDSSSSKNKSKLSKSSKKRRSDRVIESDAKLEHDSGETLTRPTTKSKKLSKKKNSLKNSNSSIHEEEDTLKQTPKSKKAKKNTIPLTQSNNKITEKNPKSKKSKKNKSLKSDISSIKDDHGVSNQSPKSKKSLKSPPISISQNPVDSLNETNKKSKSNKKKSINKNLPSTPPNSKKSTGKSSSQSKLFNEIKVDALFDDMTTAISEKVNNKSETLSKKTKKSSLKSPSSSKRRASKAGDVDPEIVKYDFSAKHTEEMSETPHRAKTIEDFENLPRKNDHSRPSLDLKPVDPISSKDVKDKETSSTNAPEEKMVTHRLASTRVDKSLLKMLNDQAESGDDSEVDNELQELFDDRENYEEFRAEKEAQEKRDEPQQTSLYLQGWGSWAGPGIVPSRRKMKKYRINVPKKPHKYTSVGSVIYNEKADVHDNLRKALVSELPQPFLSVADFEASLRQPIGRAYVPEPMHRKLTAPPVVTKMGSVIQPLGEEALLAHHNQRKEDKNSSKLEKKLDSALGKKRFEKSKFKNSKYLKKKTSKRLKKQ